MGVSGAMLDVEESVCLQCGQMRSEAEISVGGRKIGVSKKMCDKEMCEACERWQQAERMRQRRMRKELWQEQQQARSERKQRMIQRKAASLQLYEEQCREREEWYSTQSSRLCPGCQQLLPATDFSRSRSGEVFQLYTRCRECHEALRARRRPPCCLCERQTPWQNFIPHFDGYALHCAGSALPLCCQECEAVFTALPVLQQHMYIQLCCQRTFARGQVIYAEVDPETDEIRYIGRTGRPERRHAQHLEDVSPRVGQWGPDKQAWYTRGNWMQALAERGLIPSMKILRQVGDAPLVLEWEQRYIWHGIQQGWRLLNRECIDANLLTRVSASGLDFLNAPFELLVEQGFFPAQGLAAFLHKWCQPAIGTEFSMAVLY